jgi:hypothetical protein
VPNNFLINFPLPGSRIPVAITKTCFTLPESSPLARQNAAVVSLDYLSKFFFYEIISAPSERYLSLIYQKLMLIAIRFHESACYWRKSDEIFPNRLLIPFFGH